MTSSMLAAVRDAVAGAAELDPEDLKPGATTPTNQERPMSNGTAPAGGDNKPGISQAEHDTAVANAEQRGRDAGAKAANDRIAAVFAVEGIKGNAGRMGAALDLAIKSPGMSAEDVSAFVVGNVAASTATYEQQRLADAGLAQPGKPAGGNDAGKAGWAKTAENLNKRR